MVKNLPAMWEIWVQSLGWKIPWKRGNPLQYSCLENPHRQKNLVGCSAWGHKELDTTEQLSTQFKKWFKKDIKKSIVRVISILLIFLQQSFSLMLYILCNLQSYFPVF